MKHRTKPTREETLQAAYDEVSSDVDFQMEAPDDRHHRMVGVAMVIVAGLDPLISVSASADPAPPERPDDEQIKQLVTRWESASPDDILAVYDEGVTHPTMAIAAGWIDPIHREHLEQGLASEYFADQQREYPFHDPREVRLSHWRITYISPIHAAVNYHFRENYANGKQFAGNAVAIAFKNEDDQWKLAAFTKHNRLLHLAPADY